MDFRGFTVSVDASFERLKVICMAGKKGGESEFQTLEVTGINEVTNIFVRLIFNLIAKGC